MNPYMLNHFLKVAHDMHNYAAATSHYYYTNQYYQSIRDRGNVLAMYQRPSIFESGFSGLMAYGLQAIGMPAKIVNLAYRIGYFIDVNA